MWYFTVVWTCISLITSDIEHLLMWLFTIYMSFLEKKKAIQSLVHSKNCLFLLLLSCMCSFYILDINLLSDKQFTNIFSHLVGCLYVCLTVSFAVQKLLVWYSSICLFLLLFPYLRRFIQKNIAKSARNLACKFSWQLYLQWRKHRSNPKIYEILLLLLLSHFSHVWRQPTRLPCPWDSPGKNIGVGCHFFLQCVKVKSESEVTQSCPTLCDPMDCSLRGSSVHGIFQTRVLEWVAIAFSVWNTNM